MMPQSAAAINRGCRTISANGRPPCRSDGAGFGASTPESTRHRHQRDHRLHHKAECEQIGRPDIHRPLHKLGAEHAGEHAAGHDPRHRLRTVRRAGAIGGGKPVGLRHRAIKPAEEGRAAKQRKRTVQDGECAEQAGQHATAGADDEGDASPIVTRDRAGRQCASGKTNHIHRQRHGGEGDVRRQGRTDNRAGCEDHRRIRAGQCLRCRQTHHVGSRAGVVRHLVNYGRVDHQPFSAPMQPRPCRNRLDSRHYGGGHPPDQPTQTGARHASRSDSCLCMISAQTPPAFVARENRFTLFRIMHSAARTPGSDCWRASR